MIGNALGIKWGKGKIMVFTDIKNLVAWVRQKGKPVKVLHDKDKRDEHK